jgi:Zn finger protein HypA/HybF involved in hydrogenase expression
MLTQEMLCPHCKGLIETVETKRGIEYEYTIDKPQKQGGIVARIICPNCRKDFYNTITIGTGTRTIDNEVHKYKCPYCNKTIAFRHEYDAGMIANITKEKPQDKGHHPHLLISRRCDEPSCKKKHNKPFWVEVYYVIK